VRCGEGGSGEYRTKISCDEKVRIGIDCSRSRFHRFTGPSIERLPASFSLT
jgi:hypothetical protein